MSVAAYRLSSCDFSWSLPCLTILTICMQDRGGHCFSKPLHTSLDLHSARLIASRLKESLLQLKNNPCPVTRCLVACVFFIHTHDDPTHQLTLTSGVFSIRGTGNSNRMKTRTALQKGSKKIKDQKERVAKESELAPQHTPGNPCQRGQTNGAPLASV